MAIQARRSSGFRRIAHIGRCLRAPHTVRRSRRPAFQRRRCRVRCPGALALLLVGLLALAACTAQAEMAPAPEGSAEAAHGIAGRPARATAIADAGGAAGDVAGAPGIIDQSTLRRLPIQEVTVFKDGHTLLLHEGTLPSDDAGRIHLDQLPSPVLGTFWPYVRGEGAQLASVTASQQMVVVQRTALTQRELLEANAGARVSLRFGSERVEGIIEVVPVRTSEELLATGGPHQGTPPAAEKGSLLLVRTTQGLRVLPIDSISDVTFLDEPKLKTSLQEPRHVLTLQLNRDGDDPSAMANVGMMYLQRGIRWIPNYRITLAAQGTAQVELQATLLNELADLSGVTAHLVIGVPSFYFKETRDPLALGSVPSLSQYFQEPSQTAYALSNAMMTQVARMGEHRIVQQPAAVDAGADLGPELQGQQQEDLFIFTIENVSLRKGERMVVPVARYELPYEDLFTLRLPMVPPMEIRRHFNTQQQAELAQLFHQPKVKHSIRLTNRSQHPLTTAPALIVKDGHVLGQGMMTYAGPGSRTDLEITTAVDIAAHKSEEELNRMAAAAKWGDQTFDQLNVSGTISLTNFRREKVTVEVERLVLGTADEAEGGQIRRLNARDEFWSEAGYPYWWSWYSWPHWWHHLNGISRITWKVELEPGKSKELTYQWHYLWRN